MSKPGTGAAAAAAALGAWIAAPVVVMRRRGTLDEQHSAALRHGPTASPSGRSLQRDSVQRHSVQRDALHRDALRRARVREAQVRAAVAAVPGPRTAVGPADLPRRSPLLG
jgi:hypothetical protein